MPLKELLKRLGKSVGKIVFELVKDRFGNEDRRRQLISMRASSLEIHTSYENNVEIGGCNYSRLLPIPVKISQEDNRNLL